MTTSDAAAMTAVARRITELMPHMITLAGRASNAILNVYHSEQSSDVTLKLDSSPLTLADTRSHKILVSGLAVLTPEWPILSEEADIPPFAERHRWDTYWLIDPLDGTKEFIGRNGEFTINVALIHEHEVVASLVFVPVQGECYWAIKGQGAWKQDAEKTEALGIVPPKSGEPLIVVTSRNHGCDMVEHYLAKLKRRYNRTERVYMGSTLKFCAIAEGNAHVYPRFTPTSEWDTAAGQLLVEEAGGEVLDGSSNPIRYNTKDSLINGKFCALGGVKAWFKRRG